MSKNRKRKRSQHDESPPPRAAHTAPSVGELPPTSRWFILASAMVIIAAGAIVYSNSFSGAFIFDDPPSITENPHIRKLWPIWDAMKAPAEQTAAGRPVLAYSLAISYATSGLEVWGYHAFNLAVHILGGLAMFGIVRRTLLSERMKRTFSKHSAVLAIICALGWLLHPLQTESITYIIQRAESLMGLFYLLTMYCAIRSFASRRAILWSLGAIIACGLGMGTKAVMISAPIMVLLYDRVFVSKSFKELFAERWGLYAGLAATWALQAGIIISTPRGKSAGFGIDVFTPAIYAQTQCSVIMHYLRLCFWPSPLVLDYHWERVYEFKDYALPGAGVLALLAATIVAFRYRPELGFAGAWFFLILGPTSSFLPINDPIFEHRLYLPLAAIVAITVLLAYAASVRISPDSRILLRVGCLLAFGVIAAAGWASYDRNNDYRTGISIWKDTVEKWDANPRAHNNLAYHYAMEGDELNALKHYTLAIERKPTYSLAYASRAGAYARGGHYEKALADATKALDIEPERADAHDIRGVVYEKQKRYAEALAEFNQAVNLQPDTISIRRNRAVAYRGLKQFDKAIADYTEAIQLDGRDVLSYTGRGDTYSVLGQYEKAIPDYSMAISIQPGQAAHYYRRLRAYNQAGASAEAIADHGKIIQLEPDNPSSWNERGMTYGKAGNLDLAIADFDRAIQLNPNYIFAYSNRGMANSGRGNHQAAVSDFTIAIRLKSNNPAYYYNRAAAYEGINQFDKALVDYTRAVELSPNTAQTHHRLGMLLAKMNRPKQASNALVRALQLAKGYGQTQLADQIQQELDRLAVGRAAGSTIND